MSVQEFSQIIGTAAPAYAQVRQMRDNRRADRTQAELAREKLASDMQQSQNKLQYDAQQDEKKRQFDLNKSRSDMFFSPTNNMDEEARATYMDAFPEMFPAAPPPTPFPWQGQEAMGDATEGPSLPRLAENFAPSKRFSAFGKVPEAQRVATEGKKADNRLTNSKAATDEAGLPIVQSNARVALETEAARKLEPILANALQQKKITQADYDAALAQANTRSINEKTDTEIALREPTVGLATSKAEIESARVPFAGRLAEEELAGAVAGTRSKDATSGLTEKITGPTAANLEARAKDTLAGAQLKKAQAGVVVQDANTRRRAVIANEGSVRVSASLAKLQERIYNESAPKRDAELKKVLSEIDKLGLNEAVPDGLKAELEAAKAEMQAQANIASSGVGAGVTPEFTAAVERMQKLTKALPAVTNAPEYGLTANAAYGYSKKISAGTSIKDLELNYRASASKFVDPKSGLPLTPGQIDAGAQRLRRFYNEYTKLINVQEARPNIFGIP